MERQPETITPPVSTFTFERPKEARSRGRYPSSYPCDSCCILSQNLLTALDRLDSSTDSPDLCDAAVQLVDAVVPMPSARLSQPVPHHGAKTSTIRSLFENTNPESRLHTASLVLFQYL